MKIKNLLFFVLINVLVFYYFIGLSYKVNSDLFTVIVTLITLNVISIASFYLYRSGFNPITMLAPFALGLFYHQFNLSNRQEVFSTETICNIFLFFSFYIFGCVILHYKKFYVLDKGDSLLRVHVFFIIGTIVFFAESFLNDGFAIIQTLQGANAYIEKRSIPILHYFYMLIALLPACYYFLYKKQRIWNKKKPYIQKNTRSMIYMFLRLILQHHYFVLIGH